MRRFTLCLALLVPLSLWSQQSSCPTPPPLSVSSGTNLFSPKQEMDLGDAIAQQFESQYRVVQDKKLNEHLQQVGDRLLEQLPPSGMRIQFVLIDLPVLNAFTLPGGRIYVTRKMVAFANSEDDIAAVLAHELGHALTRQPAIAMSLLFQHVLGTSQLGDRQDIFAKWHEVQEKASRDKTNYKHREDEQYVADRVALYGLARAGYSPEVFADFWDRLAQTSGKTGSWLSDFFASTKPEEKRLREIRKDLASMPAACLKVTGGPSAGFQTWKASVIASSGTNRTEALPGLVWKRTLEPPLQSYISHVKFSPNGQYLLAQDDSSIYVLSRQPWGVLFRIEAADAEPAQFTPDSSSIVFANYGLRVETWSISQQKLTEANEVALRQTCLQTVLSPDGKTLACYASDFSLLLVDVKSGAQLFEKKDFYTPDYRDLLLLLAKLEASEPVTTLGMHFSPDGQYFVAGAWRTTFAFDVPRRMQVHLSSGFMYVLGASFTFLGNDRIVGINVGKSDASEEMSFPEGKVVRRVALSGDLAAATHGDVVLLRPIKDYPVGALDLQAGKIILASKEPALDVYDQVYARARLDGTVALIDLKTLHEISVVKLPRGGLGTARVHEVSKDLKWLAISSRSRGAVWNLGSGQRMFHVRSFGGAWFDDHDVLFADFPKIEIPEKQERSIGMLNPSSGEILSAPNSVPTGAVQNGSLMVALESAKQTLPWLAKDVHLEASDVRTGKTIWSKHFSHEAPQLHVSASGGRLVAVWPLSSKGGREELAQDPKSRRAGEDAGSGSVIEVFELHSGTQLGVFSTEIGKGRFSQGAITSAAGWVALGEHNRVLLYPLSDAQSPKRFFGHSPLISDDGSLICLENEVGQLSIYSTRTADQIEQLNFSKPVIFEEFSQDSKQLFVLTSDQTAYLFDLSSNQATASK